MTAASIHAADPGVKLPLDVCSKQGDSKGLFIFNLNILLYSQTFRALLSLMQN